MIGDAESMDLDVQLAGVRQRVSGIESGMAALSSQIGALSNKLDDRSRTPWATIVSAMGVVLAIVVAGGQLAKAPLDMAIVRLQQDTDRIDQAKPSLESFQTFKSTYDANRLVSRQDYDARFAAVNAEIGGIRQMLVPRGEHEEKWRSNQERLADLQRQMDEQKKAFGDTYSLRDTILDLKSRLDQVERLRSGLPAN